MNPHTETLRSIDKAHMWHPFTQMKDWCASEEDPLIIASGKGAILTDTEGNPLRSAIVTGDAIVTSEKHRRPGGSRSWWSIRIPFAGARVDPVHGVGTVGQVVGRFVRSGQNRVAGIRGRWSVLDGAGRFPGGGIDGSRPGARPSGGPAGQSSAAGPVPFSS